MVTFDVLGIENAVVAKPGAYGLSNVVDACGAVINACSSNLSTALFYDGIHPTAAGHAILANAIFATVAAVPEPATWLMLAAGVAELAVHRRRA